MILHDVTMSRWYSIICNNIIIPAYIVYNNSNNNILLQIEFNPHGRHGKRFACYIIMFLQSWKHFNLADKLLYYNIMHCMFYILYKHINFGRFFAHIIIVMPCCCCCCCSCCVVVIVTVIVHVYTFWVNFAVDLTDRLKGETAYVVIMYSFCT